MRRIGVFGGSFDPVHRGHVAVLKAAQKHFGFDWIYVVPAYRNPLKGSSTHSLSSRVRALRRALEPLKFVRLSMREARLRRPGYTVDTLRYLKSRHPSAKLYWIAGSDILSTFHRWRRPKDILRMATLAVTARPGSPLPRDRHGVEVFRMKPVRMSSSQMRGVSG